MEILVRAFGLMAHFQAGRETEPEEEELLEEEEANLVVDACAESELADQEETGRAMGFKRH